MEKTCVHIPCFGMTSGLISAHYLVDSCHVGQNGFHINSRSFYQRISCSKFSPNSSSGYPYHWQNQPHPNCYSISSTTAAALMHYNPVHAPLLKMSSSWGLSSPRDTIEHLSLIDEEAITLSVDRCL